MGATSGHHAWETVYHLAITQTGNINPYSHCGKRSFDLSNNEEQDDYITQELHIYMSAYENWKELPS